MKLAYPVVVTEKESTWKITKNYVYTSNVFVQP